VASDRSDGVRRPRSRRRVRPEWVLLGILGLMGLAGVGESFRTAHKPPPKQPPKPYDPDWQRSKQAPDFELPDAAGRKIKLSTLLKDGPVVVIWYRGAWCPFCNIALRTYQAELVPALAERGFELIAISPQKPDGSLTSAESNELTYSVASDPGNHIATALGILTEPSPDSVAAQVTLGVDLTEVNADGGKTLPMPTVVVVDAAGIIRWIDVHPNYTTRSEVSDILAAVDAKS